MTNRSKTFLIADSVSNSLLYAVFSLGLLALTVETAPNRAGDFSGKVSFEVVCMEDQSEDRHTERLQSHFVNLVPSMMIKDAEYRVIESDPLEGERKFWRFWCVDGNKNWWNPAVVTKLNGKIVNVQRSTNFSGIVYVRSGHAATDPQGNSVNPRKGVIDVYCVDDKNEGLISGQWLPNWTIDGTRVIVDCKDNTGGIRRARRVKRTPYAINNYDDENN